MEDCIHRNKDGVSLSDKDCCCLIRILVRLQKGHSVSLGRMKALAKKIGIHECLDRLSLSRMLINWHQQNCVSLYPYYRGTHSTSLSPIHTQSSASLMLVLTVFYAKYNHDKLAHVRSILDFYKGKEKTMHQCISTKYGMDCRHFYTMFVDGIRHQEDTKAHAKFRKSMPAFINLQKSTEKRRRRKKIAPRTKGLLMCARTSYRLWSNDKRKTAHKELSQLGSEQDRRRQLRQWWKQLTEPERKRYEVASWEDKKRLSRERDCLEVLDELVSEVAGETEIVVQCVLNSIISKLNCCTSKKPRRKPKKMVHNGNMIQNIAKSMKFNGADKKALFPFSSLLAPTPYTAIHRKKDSPVEPMTNTIYAILSRVVRRVEVAAYSGKLGTWPFSSPDSWPPTGFVRKKGLPRLLQPNNEPACGWHREVVCRRSGKTANRIADVYYFSPSGRKLRSGPEVACYIFCVMQMEKKYPGNEFSKLHGGMSCPSASLFSFDSRSSHCRKNIRRAALGRGQIAPTSTNVSLNRKNHYEIIRKLLGITARNKKETKKHMRSDRQRKRIEDTHCKKRKADIQIPNLIKQEKSKSQPQQRRRSSRRTPQQSGFLCSECGVSSDFLFIESRTKSVDTHRPKYLLCSECKQHRLNRLKRKSIKFMGLNVEKSCRTDLRIQLREGVSNKVNEDIKSANMPPKTEVWEDISAIDFMTWGLENGAKVRNEITSSNPDNFTHLNTTCEDSKKPYQSDFAKAVKGCRALPEKPSNSTQNMEIDVLDMQILEECWITLDSVLRFVEITNTPRSADHNVFNLGKTKKRAKNNIKAKKRKVKRTPVDIYRPFPLSYRHAVAALHFARRVQILRYAMSQGRKVNLTDCEQGKGRLRLPKVSTLRKRKSQETAFTINRQKRRRVDYVIKHTMAEIVKKVVSEAKQRSHDLRVCSRVLSKVCKSVERKHMQEKMKIWKMCRSIVHRCASAATRCPITRRKSKQSRGGAATAWTCFLKYMHPRIRSDNPGISFSDVGRRIAKLWRNLKPADKKPYEEKARILRLGQEKFKVQSLKKATNINSSAETSCRLSIVGKDYAKQKKEKGSAAESIDSEFESQKLVQPGTLNPDGIYFTLDDETPKMISEKFSNIELQDLLSQNVTRFPSLRENSRLEERTSIHLPGKSLVYCKCGFQDDNSSKLDNEEAENSTKNQLYVSCDKCCGWFHPICEGIANDTFQKYVRDNPDSFYFCTICDPEDKRGTRAMMKEGSNRQQLDLSSSSLNRIQRKKQKKSRSPSNPTFTMKNTAGAKPGHLTPCGKFYCALNNETPNIIAAKCKVDIISLIETNALHMRGFSRNARLYEGTIVCIPNIIPGTLTEEGVYVSMKGERIKSISERFSCTVKQIVQQNRSRFPDLRSGSKLLEGTHIYVPGLCKLFCPCGKVQGSESANNAQLANTCFDLDLKSYFQCCKCKGFFHPSCVGIMGHKVGYILRQGSFVCPNCSGETSNFLNIQSKKNIVENETPKKRKLPLKPAKYGSRRGKESPIRSYPQQNTKRYGHSNNRKVQTSSLQSCKKPGTPKGLKQKTHTTSPSTNMKAQRKKRRYNPKESCMETPPSHKIQLPSVDILSSDGSSSDDSSSDGSSDDESSSDESSSDGSSSSTSDDGSESDNDSLARRNVDATIGGSAPRPVARKRKRASKKDTHDIDAAAHKEKRLAEKRSSCQQKKRKILDGKGCGRKNKSAQSPEMSPSDDIRSCIICFEPESANEFVRASTCCGCSLHRSCLSRWAASSGRCFRCPGCNNTTKFRRKMARYGFKADRKADYSWKSSIDESVVQWNFELIKCEADECLCPKGRRHEDADDASSDRASKESPWSMLLCSSCGSNGEHVRCAGFDQVPEEDYFCEPCAAAMPDTQSASSPT